MSAPTLNDLVAPVTPTDALQSELNIAQGLSLPTTAWQPLSVVRTILALFSQIIATFSSVINLIAQGGLASYAAQMVDSSGNPITTWMDLLMPNMYNITRIPATFAKGTITVTNSSGSTYGPSVAGSVHLTNTSTGATYSNTSTVTITPGTNTFQVIADVAGSLSSITAGTVLAFVTPLSGVAMSPLGADINGTDAETNPAFLLRGQSKLASLSPNGAAQAYYYIATSIPTGVGGVSSPITRVGVTSNPATGEVIVALANSAGACGTLDILVASTQLQALAVPDSVTLTVEPAINAPIAVSATVYIPTAAGVTGTQVTNAVSNALGAYYSSIPIGGVTDVTPNVVPRSAVQGVIYSAVVALAKTYAAFISVSLATPAADVPIIPGVGVPTQGSTSIATVLT